MEICPRCGKEGYVEIARRGSRCYKYFVHESCEGNVRKRRRCYLGPAEGYVHVEGLKEKAYGEGYSLHNLMDEDPCEVACRCLQALRRRLLELGELGKLERELLDRASKGLEKVERWVKMLKNDVKRLSQPK